MDDDSMNNSSPKLVELLQESLHLAKTSCHFDSTHNYVGACDYYDKTIITIDDVMKMIPINSKEWIKMLNLRTKYDERLELLRYFMLTQSSTGTLLSPVILNSNDSNINSSNNNNNGNSNYNHTLIHRRNAEFHEIDLSNYSIPDLPNQSILTPYWVLSNIKQIIEHGGFITTDIFCPHNIWYQQDLKFSGISTKTAAFEIIIKLITNQIETLYLSLDEDSLTLAEAAFINISEELFNLQNQLSKPFPYIKELKPSVGEPLSTSQLSSLNSGGDNTNNNSSNTYTTSTGGNSNNSTNAINDTVVSSDNANSITSNNDSAPSTTTTNNNNNNNSQMKPSSSSRSLSQFMFAISKNVRKYAEVGYQRLSVALLTKLTAEELEEYKGLIVKLVEKTQTLRSWTSYILSMKSSPKLSQSILIKDDQDSSEVVNLKIQAMMESILEAMSAISSSIRDIAVEIVLRDLQYLMDKYLNDARKAFCRMNWDDELEVAYLDN